MARKAGHRFFSGKRPRVLGHRGDAGNYPENTMPSFRSAVRLGVDVLELDVHLTKDGVVVICHDETVDRTTDGSGAISEITYAELRKLDAGYWFTTDGGRTYPFRGRGIVIPRLADLLREFPAVPLNIELKGYSEQLIPKAYSLLRLYGRVAGSDVLLAGFDDRTIKAIRAQCRQLPSSHSSRETAIFYALAKLGLSVFFGKHGDALQVPVFHGNRQIVTRRFVRTAHRRGLEVHVWTIDEEDEMKRLLRLGVDGIFTNYPAKLRKVVDSGSWLN